MPRKSKSVIDDDHSAVISESRKGLFFAAVQISRTAMIVTDPGKSDNPIVFANQAFLDLTEFTLDEVLGRNCRFLQGEQTDKVTLQRVEEALTNQHEICVEVLNYRKDGTTFWNELFIAPLFNEHGKLVYFFASQLDVSRRRDAENGLRYAQNMEALGQLTGGIAHDFNNLLQVMIGYIELIQHTAKRPNGDPQRIVTGAGHARDAAEKARLLTQHLLAFSRRQRLQGRVINLNALLEHTSVCVRDCAELELRLDLAANLWNCRIDPTQAEIAVKHLLSNARDSLRGRDQPLITVQTFNLSVSAADDAHAGLASGRYVSLIVADNGVGIAAENLDRVMEPFFTTKEEGKGSGLGLAMVYGFVKQSGGIARLESTPGVGTKVRLYFPADDNQLWVEKQPLENELLKGAERILIVEDRREVAELAREVLTDYGYQVTIAYDAAQALGSLQIASIDLLFSDLVMPGAMNGLALAREVCRLYPATRILLTSGYSRDSLERDDISGAEFELLEKPYRPIELARKVRAVLDSQGEFG